MQSRRASQSQAQPQCKPAKQTLKPHSKSKLGQPTLWEVATNAKEKKAQGEEKKERAERGREGKERTEREGKGKQREEGETEREGGRTEDEEGEIGEEVEEDNT